MTQACIKGAGTVFVKSIANLERLGEKLEGVSRPTVLRIDFPSLRLYHQGTA
jgi:hypothetical protein